VNLGGLPGASRLERLLLSPNGLAPANATLESLLEAARDAAGRGGTVTEVEVDGDPREPARIHAVFASPGAPARRPTLVFIHGKGGRGAEWRVDAARALRLGYNALVPDLRGHAPSTGERVTYGLLEKVDLALLVAECARRFRVDPARLGVDACSAGCLVALRYAAEERTAALWLQAPFGALRSMAVQYAGRATGLPRILLDLPMRAALRNLERRNPILVLDELDPVAAARRVTCPTVIVHGVCDALVPLRFSPPVFEALAGEKELWKVPRCGHCHHPDEPQTIAKREYVERWTAFFARNLPMGETRGGA
jgi:pimeloyl-ACP methyl ester carboxylesterase